MYATTYHMLLTEALMIRGRGIHEVALTNQATRHSILKVVVFSEERHNLGEDRLAH